MALTVNPDAGARSPDTFREEGLYAFRFDLNDDSRDVGTPGWSSGAQGLGKKMRWN